MNTGIPGAADPTWSWNGASTQCSIIGSYALNGWLYDKANL